MQELVLTPEELLYCAAQLGAKRFFGLEDPFYAMEPEEICSAIAGIQVSLEQKGFAQMGFDDSFKLNSQVSALIDVCAGCEKYLQLRSSAPLQKEALTLVYYKEEKAVLVCKRGSQLHLREMTGEKLADLLLQTFPRLNLGDAQLQECQLDYALLSQVQKLAAEAPETGLEKLMEQGAAAQVAEILMQSFGNGLERGILCRGDLQKRTLDTMVLLFCDSGTVCMEPADTEEQIWRVRYASGDEAKQLVEQFCQWEEAKT